MPDAKLSVVAVWQAVSRHHCPSSIMYRSTLSMVLYELGSRQNTRGLLTVLGADRMGLMGPFRAMRLVGQTGSD